MTEAKSTKRGIVVAGLAGGSGKSVVAVGLTAALIKRGGGVVPYKKGPDYIDAGWLQLAAGRRCYNLDPFLVEEERLQNCFFSCFRDADFAIIEGNRGLYDGVNVRGGFSTADLSLTLGLPVLLVVNCSKVTRTVAAQVLGCQKFDERVNIVGVVLNEIATKRQRKLITEAVELYTGIPVIGVIPRMKTDIFPMRHLGMLPHQEYRDSHGAVERLAALVEENLDLDRLEQLMAPVPRAGEAPLHSPVSSGRRVKIGILQDAAFQFYYSANLEALESAGADLVTLSAMSDAQLPENLDGLYIGGGFPETGAAELAANRSFRESVLAAAEGGLPIYAECGGLIYLGESIELGEKRFPLVGVFPARFSMSKKPQAHGYSIFVADQENSFYAQGSRIKGHEFRYSRVEEWWGDDEMLSVKMERGKGFWNGRDGLVKKNVFALYTHIHATGTLEWAPSFVDLCRTWRDGGAVK